MNETQLQDATCANPIYFADFHFEYIGFLIARDNVRVSDVSLQNTNEPMCC